MGTRPLEPSQVRSTVALLCLLAVVLGLRVDRSVRGVLSMRRVEAAPTAGSAGGDDSLLRQLAAEDSLVQSAHPYGRDPFSGSWRSSGGSGRGSSGSRSAAPSLGALLFDSVRPIAQVEIGCDRSGWLHVGDSFEGWTVDEIGPDGVWVSRKGGRVRLTAR